MEDSSENLKKSLSLFQLTVYGVGTIIGAGIYSVISPAIELAGAGVWVSFLLAAVASSFSALSYAELASSLPSAGAEHNFLKNAFPQFPLIAFLTGCFIAVHGAATLATVALTFAGYLSTYISLYKTVVAISLIFLLTLINIRGLEKASWLNVTFTVTQISGLIILIFAAMTSTGSIGAVTRIVNTPLDFKHIVGATSVVFFIYTGYEHMASLAEEAKRPDKDVARAFLFALAITTIIYLGVIFSVLILADVNDIAKSDSPLRLAGAGRFRWLGEVLTVAALLATANAVLSASLSGSRLLYGMARTGDMPVALKKTTSAEKSPWVAALVVLTVAVMFTLIGELKFVASLSSLGALLVFALVNIAVIVLRRSKPELKRPFRVPGAIARVPIFSLLGVLVSAFLAAQYELKVYAIFAGVCFVGFATHYLTRSTTLK